jgi:hypothetical protein
MSWTVYYTLCGLKKEKHLCSMSPFWVNRNAYGLVRYDFHAQIKIKLEIFDSGVSEDSSRLAIIMLLWHTKSVLRLAVYVQATKSISRDVYILRNLLVFWNEISSNDFTHSGKYRMFSLYYNFYLNLLMFNRVPSLYTHLIWAFCYNFLFYFPSEFGCVYLWLDLCVCVLYNNLRLVAGLNKDHWR